MSVFFRQIFAVQSPQRRVIGTAEEAIAAMEARAAYVESWQGKLESSVLSLFQKCAVCATGNLAMHITTCVVAPTAALIALTWAVSAAARTLPKVLAADKADAATNWFVTSADTVLSYVHNPLVMTGLAAVNSMVVYGGWYLWKGRGVEQPVRNLNKAMTGVIFAAAATYHLGVPYAEATYQYLSETPDNRAALSFSAQLQGYTDPITGLVFGVYCGDHKDVPNKISLPPDLQRKLDAFREAQQRREIENLQKQRPNPPIQQKPAVSGKPPI